jgi:flagellar basal-body rod protein FlgF
VNVSLYQAASALNANARWQEVISENMASSSIPGFKKQELSFEAVRGGILTPTISGGQALGQTVSLPSVRNHLNFSQGDVKRTDVSTDFAIDGSALFEVQLPSGTSAYTRDGEFKISSQGQLVTKQGFLVMGEGGPIQLDPSNSLSITVGADGSISQGDQLRGKLNLVSFNDPSLLTPAGGGLFMAKDPALQQNSDGTSTIRQGSLEGSNTSSVLEMANLISVMRAYEANQRVIQMQDDRMSKAITELGSPS